MRADRPWEPPSVCGPEWWVGLGRPGEARLRAQAAVPPAPGPWPPPGWCPGFCAQKEPENTQTVHTSAPQFPAGAVLDFHVFIHKNHAIFSKPLTGVPRDLSLIHSGRHRSGNACPGPTRGP